MFNKIAGLVFIMMIFVCGVAEAKASDINRYIVSNSLESQSTIKAFRYRSWRYLSDNYIILTASRSKYLVKLKSNCLGLRYARSIVVNKMASNVLSSAFDSISFSKAHGKCYIRRIHKLSNSQAKELAKL